MNSRLKNLLESGVSLFTILIIFFGLMTLAIIENSIPGNPGLEIGIALIMGVTFFGYLIWATIALAMNRQLKPVRTKSKLMLVSFICIFFITYIFLTRDLISSCIFSLFPIWIWIKVLKEYRMSFTI